MTGSYKAPSVAQKVEALLNTLYKVAVGWQPAVAAQLTANASLLDELLPKLAPVQAVAPVEGDEQQYIPPERIILDMAIPEDRARFIRLGGDPENPSTGALVVREKDVPQVVELPEGGTMPRRPGTPPAVQKRGLSSDATRRRQVDFLDKLQLISAHTKHEELVLDPLRLRACDLFRSRFVAKLRVGAGIAAPGPDRVSMIARVIIDPPERPADPAPAVPAPADDSADNSGGEVVYGRFH